MEGVKQCFYFSSNPGYMKFNYLTNKYWVPPPCIGPVLDTEYRVVNEGAVTKYILETY